MAEKRPFPVPPSQAQTIRVGSFTLAQHDLQRIWIGHDSGESGTFSTLDFEDAIRKYFRENF